MLALPMVQFWAAFGAWDDVSPAPCSLNRNRPFWPVGRVKPGSVRGFICCWARSGGSWLLRVMTVVLPDPDAVVVAVRGEAEMPAENGRSTPLEILFVAVMETLPPAWMMAGTKLSDEVEENTSCLNGLRFFIKAGSSARTPVEYFDDSNTIAEEAFQADASKYTNGPIT